ncbi:MAG: DUF86 domain-containing protein [Candidatus Kapabacteria bacterium]|jgi:uncharacterized protein with HEPN domain|nr:DUF86 domain-containing protein [Candidatus Kapabacteria bacterium]
MFKPGHRDFSCLLNIIDSIIKIKNYSKQFKNADDFYEDSKSFDAVMMNFVVIGEMAEKLSEDFIIETETQIDWFKIRGFRNIIAHNYFGIDAEEVWQIIFDNLDKLESDIKSITENS